MHPDPYYTYRASTSRSCHGKKAKKKSKQAKYWGTPAGYVKKPYFGFTDRESLDVQ